MTNTRDIHVGRLYGTDGFHGTLTESSWVGDTGYWCDFLRDGRADDMEVEPEGTFSFPMAGSCYWPWRHPLFAVPNR
jgi:hypothetical protein